MLGAIIIGEQCGAVKDRPFPLRFGTLSWPWATIDVLGKPLMLTLADDFKKKGCDAVSVIANATVSHNAGTAKDFATQSWENYKRHRFDTVLIAGCGAYVELDIGDMFTFHQRQSAGITRASTDNGLLDVWMVDMCAVPDNVPALSVIFRPRPVLYRFQGYVNRLQTPRDLRRLVLDSLYSRCLLRPQGSEVKPGIWVCGGAQIERSARIVGPAFIGWDTQISDECLITRGSNVESNSRVDFGTVVEDSSILANTYVGVGLDLCHSIADGNKLLNLRHNVDVEITDPLVMRQNTVRGGQHHSWPFVEHCKMAASTAAK